jgi:hypothetical protein
MAKKASRTETRPQPATWSEVGYRNAGLAETLRALKFALTWGLATARLGREPETVDKYATVTGVSRAKAFRDQQAFRRAFPTETTPGRMNRVSGAQEQYAEMMLDDLDVDFVLQETQPYIFTLGAAPADV